MLINLAIILFLPKTRNIKVHKSVILPAVCMDMKIGHSPQEKNTDSECSRILVMKIKGTKKLIKGKTKNTAKFFLFIKLG